MNNGKISARYDASNAEDRTILVVLVWSVMLFPDDEKKRGEFQDGLLGNAFETVVPELSSKDIAAIGAPFIFDLAKAATSFDTNLDESLRAIKLSATRGAPAMLPGKIAGNIVLLALLAWAQDKRTGLTAIYKAIAGKDDRGGSVRTLQKVWRDYGPVAHLWAAFLATGGIPDDDEKLVRFLSFAEFLRRWATTYVPDRANEPIMDPTTAVQISGDSLQAVDLPLASLEPSNEVLKRLNLSKPSGTVTFTSERVAFTCEQRNFTREVEYFTSWAGEIHSI
jgi:hypothetical protein